MCRELGYKQEMIVGLTGMWRGTHRLNLGMRVEHCQVKILNNNAYNKDYEWLIMRSWNI